MVYWQKFNPQKYEFEFDEDELSRHGVTADEAIEVIWNGFDVSRNKKHHVGYQITGSTDGGRLLKLIVYQKRPGLIRVVTGWQL